MRRATLAGALAGFLALTPGAAAEFYRWTDAEGHVHFTQDLREVPPAQRSQALDGLREPSRFQSYAAPEAAASAARSGWRGSPPVLQLPFERHGNAMLVRARLNDRADALFVVDTGASDVAIPAALASRAGIVIGPDTPRQIYQTAGGPVSSPVVMLDSIQVGEVRVERIRAHVSHAMDIGLLGGTFFNHFTTQIDPASHLITLVPNDRVRGGLSERQWRERFRLALGQLERLKRYMTENHFSREGRVAELERSREELERELESLEEEADAAEVPQAWRE